MAHPKLTRRADHRVLVAAGAAALLASSVALGTPGAGALPLDSVTEGLDCSVEALAGNPELEERCADAGLLSVVDDVVPEEVAEAVDGAVGGAVDPIGKVVDDVLKSAPAPVGEVAEQVPEVVDQVTEAVPTPTAPTEPQGTPAAPSGAVTAAGPTSTPSSANGPLQGPGLTTPPFLTRGVSSDTTTTTRSRTGSFVTPVVSGPVFAELPRIAERFFSDRSVTSFSADAFAALRGVEPATTPSPDAPTWLLATAGGMLLLLGAGHVLHARQRYATSIAR